MFCSGLKKTILSPAAAEQHVELLAQDAWRNKTRCSGRFIDLMMVAAKHRGAASSESPLNVND